MDYLLSRGVTPVHREIMYCSEVDLVVLLDLQNNFSPSGQDIDTKSRLDVDCTTTLLKLKRFSPREAFLVGIYLLQRTVFSSKIQTVL
jgi:hypothetical protein